jgi:hypothetical protein
VPVCKGFSAMSKLQVSHLETVGSILLGLTNGCITTSFDDSQPITSDVVKNTSCRNGDVVITALNKTFFTNGTLNALALATTRSNSPWPKSARINNLVVPDSSKICLVFMGILEGQFPDTPGQTSIIENFGLSFSYPDLLKRNFASIGLNGAAIAGLFLLCNDTSVLYYDPNPTSLQNMTPIYSTVSMEF